MGVIVLFAQSCERYGVEIVSIQSAFPDAVIRKDNVEYKVEFEYYSSNFIQHRHDPRQCDLKAMCTVALLITLIVLLWEIKYLAQEILRAPLGVRLAMPTKL